MGYMLDMKQLLPLLILIDCHMIQGVLEWTVTGKVTDFGQNVTLFCHVPNCCPKEAGWDRWTPVQQTLFIDVKTGHTNKKYDGKAEKDGYTLVIQNLTKEDLNVSYSCLYDVTLGPKKFLLEGDVFTDKSDTTPTDNSGFSEIQIAGIILGIAVTVAVAVVVFVIFNRKKRNKRPTNKEGKPLLEIEPHSNIECKEGGDAALTCKVPFGDQPVIWTKDGKAISCNEHYAMSNDGKEHKLTIKQVKLDDNGEYCIQVGKFFRKFHLKIIDCFLENPSNVEYKEGEDAILTCKVSPNSLPVEWFKDGSAVELDENCTKSIEGTKHILRIKHVQSDDSGEYCVKVGNFSRKQQLTIKDCFLENPTSVEYIEGEEAILTCKVSPTSLPVEWFKDGNAVELDDNCEQSNEGTKHILSIKHVKSDDSGEYCVKVGNFSRKLQLKIKDYFLEGPSHIECIEGEDATLTCKIRSKDQSVNWMKDGKEKSLNKNCTMSNQGTKYNLTIKNVKSDDSGEYCMQVGKFSKNIKLKIKDIQDAVIPQHIREQFDNRTERWKKEDQQFVSTEAEKHVMQKVLTESTVTLVGNSGIGKSFLSKHIALKMKKHGYTVIPCSKPEDIGKWFKHGRKTLFVYDDVCGRYTLNQQIYNDWKQHLDHIKSLLADQCCKIISTCRLEVFKDERFSNLSIFKMCNINLSSQEFKLSATEKNTLAEVYFKDNADEVKELSEKYDFFPLLCSLYHKQNLQKKVSISSFLSNPFTA